MCPYPARTESFASIFDKESPLCLRLPASCKYLYNNISLTRIYIVNPESDEVVSEYAFGGNSEDGQPRLWLRKAGIDDTLLFSTANQIHGK
jgi:hypothetical protein